MIIIMGTNTTIIEKEAVLAVEKFILRCPKLESIIQSNDKTPIWDGDILIYNDEEEHKVENFLARVPVQVKGTTNTKDDFYRIEHQYIEAYQADRGCVFFMVQVDKDLDKHRILYAMLSLADVDVLLQQQQQQQTKTIRIFLQEIPTDRLDFENELIKFTKKRS